jgi:hypothetical protein
MNASMVVNAIFTAHRIPPSRCLRTVLRALHIDHMTSAPGPPEAFKELGAHGLLRTCACFGNANGCSDGICPGRQVVELSGGAILDIVVPTIRGEIVAGRLLMFCTD